MYLFILIITLFGYLIWRFGTRNFDYWKKKGVKHDKPMFFFGNMYRQFKQEISLGSQVTEWYKRFPGEQYVGVHLANNLALVLRDPELIKRVLITDFQYFHQRGFHAHKHVREPLFQNLFTCDGDVWKLVRQRLTPAFSGAKIKAMFPLIQRSAEKMLAVTNEGTYNIRDHMTRYTIDFIAACGFGLDIDTFNDDCAIFQRLGKRLVNFTTRDALVHFLKRLAPELFKHLNYFVPEVSVTMTYLVQKILQERNYMPSERRDFIDLLIELKQKGKMVGQSIEHFNPDGTPKSVEMELDDQLITAQVFIFFGAGFETSSSAISFLLHELAFAPEIQERCRREVDDVLSRHDGKITFEGVKEMVYLEMAFKEAIRLHSSPVYLMRKCGRKYTFPDNSLTIDEDVTILVPLQALQKDPQYFDDPETFRPDRFSADNVESIPKCVYLPFGDGPRACIGERLGKIQSLAGVAALLSRFRVEPAPASRRHPLMDPKSYFVENVIGGLPLTLVRREPTI